MTRKLLPLIFFIALLLSAVEADGQKKVRWEAGTAGSEQFKRHGLVVKRLTVDGVVIEASIKDGITVGLRIDNQGQQSLHLLPDQISLEVVSPISKQLEQESASSIGARINLQAETDAINKENIGRLSTKTVRYGWAAY